MTDTAIALFTRDLRIRDNQGVEVAPAEAGLPTTR